jgi:hypothetical protein
MGKVLLIDVAAREVREVEVRDDEAGRLKDLHKLIGGYIESAWSWDSGDYLFVDEEGTFKAQKNFFRLEPRGDYPFAGNGVLVGPERYDDEGEFLGNSDPTLTVEQLASLVTYVTREQADAWGKGNASEPACVFYSIGPNGELIEEEVIARMGQLFADMPKPEDDKS